MMAPPAVRVDPTRQEGSMHMPVRPFAAAVAAGAFAALLGAAALARAEPPSPEAVVDAFEAALGPIRTHRPSHAKGTCAAGEFVATPEGARLSVAPVFDGQRVPAVVRFGVGGGDPRAPDTGRSTRGLSIRFETQTGDLW